MVPDLVLGVDRQPCELAFQAPRVVVHDGAIPVSGSEQREDVGEKQSSVGELASDVVRRLLRVAVVIDPFVSAHRVEGRPLAPPRRQHPLPLDEEHISDVAAVLQRRPRLWPGPGPQNGRVAVEQPGEGASSGDDVRGGLGSTVQVVLESARVTPIHTQTIDGSQAPIEPCGPRSALPQTAPCLRLTA